MSNRGRGGRRKGANTKQAGWSKPPNIAAEPDLSDNPVALQFGEFSKMLDDRHDRHERIVKISRDITIESKRIIFALHRIQGDADKPVVMDEAEQRFRNVNKNLWRKLALELRGRDAFQYLRGYTAGLQEYIEALSFYHFLKHRTLVDWKTVQEQLTFEFVTKKQEAQELEDSLECVKIEDDCEEDVQMEGENKPMLIFVPQTDYMLGLADLTGELMRNAINSVAAGDVDVCFSLLTFLQQIDDGFNRLDKSQTPNQVNRKLTVLKQSLRKVEMACYNINVRGSELPKNYLADVINNYAEDGYKREEDTPYFDN